MKAGTARRIMVGYVATTLALGGLTVWEFAVAKGQIDADQRLTARCDSSDPTSIEVDGRTYVVACPARGTFTVTRSGRGAFRLAR